MRNAIGQEVRPGDLVAKSADRNGYLKYGVVVSVGDDHSAEVHWTHEPGWYGGVMTEPKKYSTRYGKNDIDKLAVIDPATVSIRARSEIISRTEGLNK